MFSPNRSSLSSLNAPQTASSATTANHNNAGVSQHPRSLSGSFSGANPNSGLQSTQEPLNLRSCVTCRRRKVRCNKRTPCSNCIKAGIECVFPAPGRAPRKPKRPQDAELLSRLRRLEGVIERIRDKKGDGSSSPEQPRVAGSPVESRNLGQAQQQDAAGNACEMQKGEEEPSEKVCPALFDSLDPKKVSSRNVENEFGRLVIEEGRSRYVSNRFWASLGDEIEEMQDILDPSSSDEDDYPSPDSSTNSSSHEGFLMGFYSLSHSLRGYHPSPDHVSVLWSVYMENVAPLISILHRPTVKKLLDGPARNPSLLDKNSEALAFAVYFVSIVSMRPENCLHLLGDTRDALVSRYRFAVEQALAKANLLNTQNLMLLQAAVLFLIGVRREDDTKFVWAMTAVVLRLAQGLGLHRDGSNFGLKPFENEMRRRLWWHICLLDIRASEDHGTDSQINDRMYDTRLPLNINDEEITPEMLEPPTEHEGATQMTFSLVRFEITAALRRVSYSCPSGKFRWENQQTTNEKCANIIKMINHRMEERYIKHCDMSVPIFWVSATVTRLILAKLWLTIHHPMTRHDGKTNISQVSRENLFYTSIEVVEFARLLETNEHTSKWGWLFATNMQWHCVAFVLAELCVRPASPITERAWQIVNCVYNLWGMNAKHKKGMLWRPISKLMKRATAVRAKQQEQMRAQLSYNPEATEYPTFLPAQVERPSVGHPLPQFLPRMDISPDLPVSTSSPEVAAGESGVGLRELDITKEPINILGDLFPDTDWLAMGPSPQSQLREANMPETPNISTALDNTNQQDLPNPQLNWEEWDQVMRDFQSDLRTQANEPMGNVFDWLA